MEMQLQIQIVIAVLVLGKYLLSFGAGPLKLDLNGTSATFPISFGGLVNWEWYAWKIKNMD